MNKFKKGDKVNIHDGSYCFGIQNGEYSGNCNHQDGSRKNLTVVKTNLRVVCLGSTSWPNELSGRFTAVDDLLVTNNNGSFWFTQSRFCNLIEPTHHIVIDGHGIVLSHKSFLALKEQFV